MAGMRARLIPASDRTLLLTWGDTLTLPAHRQVVRLLGSLDRSALRGAVDVSPAGASILIRFDPRVFDHAAVAAQVEALLADDTPADEAPERIVEIPVSYGGEHGPDLEEVARRAGLSPDEVVQRHAGTTYDVFFLGFLPGFAYMGSVPEAIASPRLPKPRAAVPAGSVGIAGRMTGIYPMPTPGGWRIIGRTPLSLFDPQHRPMALLQAGDRVRFTPIDFMQPVAIGS
jgi:KipI family sensor histidine kinase inhibitor